MLIEVVGAGGWGDAAKHQTRGTEQAPPVCRCVQGPAGSVGTRCHGRCWMGAAGAYCWGLCCSHRDASCSAVTCGGAEPRVSRVL